MNKTTRHGTIQTKDATLSHYRSILVRELDDGTIEYLVGETAHRRDGWAEMPADLVPLVRWTVERRLLPGNLVRAGSTVVMYRATYDVRVVSCHVCGGKSDDCENCDGKGTYPDPSHVVEASREELSRFVAEGDPSINPPGRYWRTPDLQSGNCYYVVETQEADRPHLRFGALKRQLELMLRSPHAYTVAEWRRMVGDLTGRGASGLVADARRMIPLAKDAPPEGRS